MSAYTLLKAAHENATDLDGEMVLEDALLAVVPELIALLRCADIPSKSDLALAKLARRFEELLG